MAQQPALSPVLSEDGDDVGTIAMESSPHPAAAAAPSPSPTASESALSPVPVASPLHELGAVFVSGSRRSLHITCSVRNLSSNSSVVALFEAKDPPEDNPDAADAAPTARAGRILEYVGHTEGIRHSHNPNFQVTRTAAAIAQGK